MEKRIVERPRDHAERLEPQRVDEGVQLPEAEVAGKEQHAAALRVRQPRAILPVELDTRQHRLFRERAELQELHEQPAEMRERGTRDRLSLAFRA